MMKWIRNVVTETKESKNLGTETLEQGTIELKNLENEVMEPGPLELKL